MGHISRFTHHVSRTQLRQHLHPVKALDRAANSRIQLRRVCPAGSHVTGGIAPSALAEVGRELQPVARPRNRAPGQRRIAVGYYLRQFASPDITQSFTLSMRVKVPNPKELMLWPFRAGKSSDDPLTRINGTVCAGNIAEHL